MAVNDDFYKDTVVASGREFFTDESMKMIGWQVKKRLLDEYRATGEPKICSEVWASLKLFDGERSAVFYMSTTVKEDGTQHGYDEAKNVINKTIASLEEFRDGFDKAVAESKDNIKDAVHRQKNSEEEGSTEVSKLKERLDSLCHE